MEMGWDGMGLLWGDGDAFPPSVALVADFPEIVESVCCLPIKFTVSDEQTARCDVMDDQVCPVQLFVLLAGSATIRFSTTQQLDTSKQSMKKNRRTPRHRERLHSGHPSLILSPLVYNLYNRHSHSLVSIVCAKCDPSAVVGFELFDLVWEFSH